MNKDSMKFMDWFGVCGILFGMGIIAYGRYGLVGAVVFLDAIGLFVLGMLINRYVLKKIYGFAHN
jgi:hypothetical protein